ncbi:MAG TPA: FkbM family methyltransferase [Pyrinomonadaceae bacterium]|nr:FkbM family methyltransferase [Pyrinomonadaceae bacterium]
MGTLRDSILRWYVGTPEHPSKYRIVRWLGRNCFPTNGIKTDVNPGVQLFLHPRDWIEYWLLAKNDYEPLTLDFITKNLRPGDNAVFAGVNFGLHVITAARAVGQHGKVIGVEPQPAALLRAQTNMRLNGVTDRIELVSAALGPEESFVHMAWAKTDENAGAASLLDVGEGLTVRLIQISQVFDMLETHCIQLLLLDVQGYEVHVLKGLSMNCLPQIVIAEVEPELLQKARTSEAELLQMFHAYGYQTYTLGGDLVSQPDMGIPEKNIVAVKGANAAVWVRAA